MKKLFAGLVIILTVVSFVYAAGTVTQTTTDVSEDMRVVTLKCVGSATTGAISDTDFPPVHSAKTLKGYYLYRAIVDNDSSDTNCTDNSDVYIKDPGGTDLLLGEGVDALDNKTRNYLHPLAGTLAAYEPVITEQLTLDVDNNSVNASSYTIDLIFVKPKP